jgi:DnaK suppressor protein
MAKRKQTQKQTARKSSKNAVRKPSSKKKVARKKLIKKKVSKKKVSKKKAGKKKTAKKKAAKKTAKKAAKKTAKKAAKKAAKKTSRKKVSKKKASKKTASRKKASKTPTSRKKVTKKKTSSKKASKKKVSKKVIKKAPAKSSAKKAKGAADATDPTPRKKKLIITPIKSRVSRPTLHKPVNPADQIPIRPKRRKTTNTHLIHGIIPYKPAKGEEYMNDDQLEHFSQILNAWKDELMNEVDRTVHHMQDEASNFPDPTDRATQESEFGLELRTRDRERKLLKKIHQAIGRVEDQTYGYCEETGEEIGLKRLEARPVATLAVEAQERRELAERQYRDQEDRYR